jgi:hypothetical protein
MDHEVRARYEALNGRHPMAANDDAYVRTHFVPVPDEPDWPRASIHEAMLAGELPLPSYVLSDGEAMVHPDYLALVRLAGSTGELRRWFVAQWPPDDEATALDEWDAYLSGQYVCLSSVTPATIQRKTQLIEAIRPLVEQLDAGDGGDDRAELAELVDALDELEPPFTGYDRLRFAGPTSRDVWIDGVRARHL